MRKNNIIALTRRISEKAHRFIIRELELRGITGIVPSHGGILSLLFSGEQYTMKEIAAKIHRTKPTVTVLVDKLVQKGYVIKVKNSEDSRSTFLQLTPKGEALQPVVAEVSQAVNAIVYQDMTEADAEAVESLLQKISQQFDES